MRNKKSTMFVSDEIGSRRRAFHALAAGLCAGLLAAGCVPGLDGASGEQETSVPDETDTDETQDAEAAYKIVLRIESSVLNYDVYEAAGEPAEAVDVLLVIAPNAIVGSASPLRPALTTGAFPHGSRLLIRNRGAILGAGGAGGSGGNGGSGSWDRPCGRDGGAGGAALSLGGETEIEGRGLIFGGGGGGGGVSGCNEVAGGGGGAGSTGGAGGPGATTLSEAEELAFCAQDNGYREGPVGTAGSLFAPGTGGVRWLSSGGTGGGFGLPGSHSNECIPFGGGAGGAAGAAIERNGHALTGIADGAYDTGTGAIRGPVH